MKSIEAVPSVKTEKYELWLGKAEEVLPNVAPCSLLLTDPPYGIGESSSSVVSRQKKRGGNSRALANQRDYGSFDWDNAPISDELLVLCRAKGQYQIIWGGNYYDLPKSPCWLVWDKMNGSNDFADCELAWTNLPKAVRMIQHRWNGMLRQGQEPRYHPTQKPLGVMAWALGQAPSTVETVLDPFMGSGTTGVAAIQSSHYFIGIECDPTYFEIARQRLEVATGKFSPRETSDYGGIFANTPLAPTPGKGNTDATQSRIESSAGK